MIQINHLPDAGIPASLQEGTQKEVVMGRRGLLIVAAAALTAAAAATTLAAIVSLAELAEKQVKRAAGKIALDLEEADAENSDADVSEEADAENSDVDGRTEENETAND